VLILIKKIHQSYYPLEYLQLLRQLFKNVNLFNKYDYLIMEFQYLCSKQQKRQGQSQEVVHYNVNIIENFIYLFNSGIDEIKQIVTEIVLLMPLNTKYSQFTL